jgi:cell division transport system permease protein
MSRLVFFTREAFRALRRNAAPSMAAIVTTVVTVVLLGVLIPALRSTQDTSNKIRNSLEFRVSVYDDATQGEVDALQRKLEAIPHVASIHFLTKADALAELKDNLGKQKANEILRQLNGHNPLPGNFAVKADDAANLAGVRAAVTPPGPDGKPKPISSIIPAKHGVWDPQEDLKKVEKVTSALKIILSALTALLIVASLMLVGNTIRLSIFTRRREIEVMRLVGATRWFIRWPFMIEGVIVGFTGGLIAILVLWLGKITVVDPLGNSLAFLASQNFPLLVGILFGSAVLVSALGSGITLRRFLKV